MIKIDIKEKIIDAVKILDEIDNYTDTLQDSLSSVDLKICDLMHYIEFNKLKTNECYRIVKELHKLRVERRKIKNDMELSGVLKTHNNKLLESDNRKILLSYVGKTDKALKNSKYQNRVYTKEELEVILVK